MTTYTSAWKDEQEETVRKLLNRESFSYDLNADALYRQYKDSYLRQGKQAMEDTVGKVSTLTGGYGNSYAQTAGQQTYNGYLQQLGDKIPQLHAQALDRYNAEGARLQNQLSVLMQQEGTDYDRYRDSVADEDAAFNRLLTLMTEFGYRPSAEELELSGMTADHVLAILGPESTGAATRKKGNGTPGDLRLQMLLNGLGADLELDGIRGSKTKAAMKQYADDLAKLGWK
jgi:hypothetical protein